MTYPRYPLYPATYPSTYGVASPPFPDIPLDLRAELLLNGIWTDVTHYLDHGPVTTGRGHPDESTQTPPSTLALTLTNGDGRFATRNPASPYYPYLVRNTPVRVSIPAQTPYLRLEASSGWAYATDCPRLQVTGDIDIRADIKPSSYQAVTIASKADLRTAGNYGWVFAMNADMSLSVSWTPDGSTVTTAGSVVPLPSGRICVRVTLAVATGTVFFYTAPALSGPWTQLGTPGSATGGAATSVFAAATVPLRAGYAPGSAAGSYLGRFYGLQLYNGVGGTLVADAGFTSNVSPGLTNWTDSLGNTWWLGGAAEISQRLYRLHAEAAEFPQQQDPSGKTVTVPLSGGGLLRRTSQRNESAGSPMRRAYTKSTATAAPVAYWPMEDGASATQCASATGGTAMWFSGTPKLASSSAFACSDPLPVMNGASFTAQVPATTSTWTANVCRLLMAVPSAGDAGAAGAAVAAIATTGTVTEVTFLYSNSSGGLLAVTGYNSSGAGVFSGTLSTPVNGNPCRASFSLDTAGQPAGTVKWTLEVLYTGQASVVSTSGTFTGTVGPTTRVQLNPGGQLTQTAVGHCSVQASYDSLLDLYGPLNAWTGELAGNRFARLCGEEQIPFRSGGNLGATIAMGTQTSQTVTQLLQECADADRGIWTELRQALGWGYTPRSALYNQPADVTLDYSSDNLAMWSAPPKEDDQAVVNDVTVSQTSGGSSSRQYAAPGQPIPGGRLSTQAPPQGARTYDQSYTLNLANASDLDDVAGWILHLGTVDQPRYPGLVIDLANRTLTSQSALFWALLDLDIGDRLVVTHPPAWLGPDAISVLINGMQEQLFYDTLTLTVNGIPEVPYEVAQDGTYHFGTDGSYLAAAVTATATTMQFATTPGNAVWTQSGIDMPFDVNIGGERVTVTAITGPTSPQPATVIRSVNGVVKAQAAYTAITMFQPAIAAL